MYPVRTPEDSEKEGGGKEVRGYVKSDNISLRDMKGSRLLVYWPLI